MKRCFIGTVIFCTFILLTVHAVQANRPAYSGGMLIYQPGFSITSNPHQDIREFNSSIGGILRFYLGKYLTVGAYGGSQKTYYNTSGSENSFTSLGYGGPFVGLSHLTGKMRFTASAFAGQGTLKNLHIQHQNDANLVDADLYIQPVMVFSPIISIDYAITARISFTVQAVCLYAGLNDNHKYVSPALQFGFLISR